MKSNHPISTLIFALIFGAAALPAMASAASSTVRDVRLWTAPDHTRLVFDLNRSIEYKVFRLHKPERIVIDLKNTSLKANFNKLAIPDPVIKAIRHGTPKANILRVVMDVKENVQPRSSLLKPMQGKPYRLVIDLMRPQKEQAAAITAGKSAHKKIVIAVDAGHGGEDPGAIGQRKLREKDVTLAVAKRLAKIINAKPGMKAVLIRKGDYFVSLRKRIHLARRAKADMMVSIHADAVRNRSVQGASVYTLSERGATPDRAARALAAKENAADEVGGVGADEAYDSQVNKILSDMFRRDSLNSSQILAEEMLRKLKKTGSIKYRVPKRARFFVLKAMEIPSVLVELDYISNPAREKKLKNGKHQQKLASALFDASIRFLERMGRLKTKQSRVSGQQQALSLLNANADGNLGKQPSI
jgi:N-acetylmuramoyl-L-alanine amidase